jgi:hypothetical protein
MLLKLVIGPFMAIGFQVWITPFPTMDIRINGKAIPLEAWKGPKGSRRLRLQNFKTIGT